MENALLQQLVNRLDKLDEKLDVLVATMARYDERLSAGSTTVQRHEFRLDHIEGRVNNIENSLSKLGGKNIIWERAAWIVFSAAVALLVNYGQ